MEITLDSHLLTIPTNQFLVELFHNYGFKEWILVKDLKLWQFAPQKNFYDGHTFKADIALDNILIKMKSQGFTQRQQICLGDATVPKQMKYFSNTDNSTTLTFPGPPGASKEAKLSTEFEFGSLVL